MRDPLAALHHLKTEDITPGEALELRSVLGLQSASIKRFLEHFDVDSEGDLARAVDLPEEANRRQILRAHRNRDDNDVVETFEQAWGGGIAAG